MRPGLQPGQWAVGSLGQLSGQPWRGNNLPVAEKRSATVSVFLCSLGIILSWMVLINERKIHFVIPLGWRRRRNGGSRGWRSRRCAAGSRGWGRYCAGGSRGWGGRYGVLCIAHQPDIV